MPDNHIESADQRIGKPNGTYLIRRKRRKSKGC